MESNALENCLGYPNGKRTNISDNIPESLGRVGIEYSLSAYGGSNGSNWDPHDVLRYAVDANFSDLAFRAMAEEWRVSPG